MSECCENCRFSGDRMNYDDYQCLRHAPIVHIVPHWKDGRETIPVWPIMHGYDWCGDWEQTGEKVK